MTAPALAGVLESNPLIEICLPAALIVIMAGVGLSLAPRDFSNVLARPAALVAGTAWQLLALPFIAIGLGLAFGLAPLTAVGLVIIAAAPGGTASNVLTYLARGNLALSILTTALCSLLAVVTLPVFANLALALFAGGGVEGTPRLPVLNTIVMLLGLIFVPVLVGMWIRARRPGLARRLEPVVGAFGMIVLLALITLIAYQVRHHLVALLIEAGPAVLALNAACVASGLVIARLVSHPVQDGITLAIELGVKNSTIGLMVALTMLQSAEIAVPAALYGLLMYGLAAGLVVYGRHRPNPAGLL